MFRMIQKYGAWRVFAAFARNPRKPYQVRELSRNIGLAATSVQLHLKELERMGLVRKEKAGVYDAYKSDFESDSFRFYKGVYNIVSLHDSGLIEELERKTSPDAIVLFGSYAKGEDLENSDIDIFLIAKEKSIVLEKYEKRLNRKIQLFFSEDIGRLPKELLNNILNGRVLRGFVRWKG